MAYRRLFITIIALSLVPIGAHAIDFGRLALIVENSAGEMGRGIINSGQYRSLVVDSLLVLTATIFFVYQLLKSALTSKEESPWAVYINVCLTIAAVALIGRLYDDVTDAVDAFGNGLLQIVRATAFNGTDPMETVMKAEAYIRTDPLGLNFMQDLAAGIQTLLINFMVAMLQIFAWAATNGAQDVFIAVKVLGYVTVPFLFFRWAQPFFTGTIKAIAWTVLMKPAAAVILAITALKIEKFLELGGGKIPELTTAHYGELAGLLATFGVSCIVLVLVGTIVAMIVGGRDMTTDVSGFLMGATTGGLSAGGWIMGKLNRAASRSG